MLASVLEKTAEECVWGGGEEGGKRAALSSLIHSGQAAYLESKITMFTRLRPFLNHATG